MEQLIFFGVIIIFAILDSVAKTKKARAAAEAEVDGGGPTPIPEGWEEGLQDPDVSTYDPEPSHVDDDDDGVPGEPLPRYARPHDSEQGPAEPEPVSRGPSSEMPLPSDLLEELAGLAGRLEDTRPAGSRLAPAPERQSTGPSPTRAVPEPPTELPARPEHRVHLAHADYGTDPSERAPSEQDGLDPLAVPLSADASWVRHHLRSRGFHALRQAVVMQEVLGPPAALRRDRFED